MQIQRASKHQLADIKEWLRATGSAFEENWPIIAEAQGRAELFIALDGAQIVAFCVASTTTVDIFEVREDRRKKGTGRQLAQHIIDKARAAGSWGLIGFCRPTDSLVFWRRVGFERVTWDLQEEFRVVYAFRENRSPPQDIDVKGLSFTLHTYPKDDPAVTKTIPAIAQEGGYVLSQDFLEFVPIGDMRLTISCESGELFNDKCKNAGLAGGKYRFPWVRFPVVELRDQRGRSADKS
jgi:GNAT superfamily N-acetyltransferase